MNLSMTVLFALLYIGATPVEAVMSMLVFNPFTYFTVYTQQHILGIKDLTFFPGAKMLIPVIVTLALATFNPFVGIIIFIALFLAESFAKVYKAMDVKKRPSARHIVFMTFGASALMIIGLLLVQWFRKNITISWQERCPWFLSLLWPHHPIAEPIREYGIISCTVPRLFPG